MGLESVVACMPTMFMSGDSAAPMENSPPGIHTMPCGRFAGSGSSVRDGGLERRRLGRSSRLPGSTGVEPPPRAADRRQREQHEDRSRRVTALRTAVDPPAAVSCAVPCDSPLQIPLLSSFAAVPNGPSWYTAAPAGEKGNDSNFSPSIVSR